jgi:small-conductance mechanosensitive channel
MESTILNKNLFTYADIVLTTNYGEKDMSPILRDTLKWLILITITIGLWVAHRTYPNEYLQHAVYTVFSIAVLYLGLRVLFENLTLSRIEDIKTKYSFRKGITIVYYVMVLVTIATIWVENTQGLLVSFGIIGAGLAIALQDVFRNFAGSIFIISSGLYTVGDRIEINEKVGDVIDIGLWNTTLMEIKGWVAGDQQTGRITLVPNGQVIATAVFNYTKDFPFIWDEITVPLTYQSDWKKAITIFSALLQEQNDQMAEEAEKAIDRVGTKYYLIRKGVEPAIYISMTSNWVQLSLRYVVDVRQRRQVRNDLSRKILEAVEASDAIEIGSSTITVTGRHEIALRKEEVNIERP